MTNATGPLRVMWLINHTSLRTFEVKQLHRAGVREVFLPKSFPHDEPNLSSSVDYSQDASLSIPAADLAVLNAADWYRDPGREAWDIANRQFQIIFCSFVPDQLDNITRNFRGACIMRAFGLDSSTSYERLLYNHLGPPAVDRIRRMGRRFWFGQAYDHLCESEPGFLRDRSCHLPVGLSDATPADRWTGEDARVLFVCPRIGTSPYYEGVYRKFLSDFPGVPYVIGGAQPIAVPDDNVLGFVPREEHDENMRRLRVMYYHSTEPNHIHLHPFEAIRAGMPLVFMGGGMLDRLGGMELPGRCKDIAEARSKLKSILAGDRKLIAHIRESQGVLLDKTSSDKWRDGFRRIVAQSKLDRPMQATVSKQHKRIAVIVAAPYRGGTLRGAMLLARAIYEGSRQHGQAAEMVLAHLDDEQAYPPGTFDTLPAGITRRSFIWKTLDPDEARRAMRYAGHEGWEGGGASYLYADDGTDGLADCDLWIVVSDRLETPVLPIRPCVHMVFDYLQRYTQILPNGRDQPFLDAARSAVRVLVTTEFTKRDALQYAGLRPDLVTKVPMLAPCFSDGVNLTAREARPYFVWTTNNALHKNHDVATQALEHYYDYLGGQFACQVTGTGSDKIPNGSLPHLAEAAYRARTNRALRLNVRWLGNVSEFRYQALLAGAAFLWHPAKIDNGTFAVIEAASLGVPALSTSYPAMHEIDETFSLNLAWANASDYRQIAGMLKEMELTHERRRAGLPSRSTLARQAFDDHVGEYWKVIRECL